jgi:hypothetical protein
MFKLALGDYLGIAGIVLTLVLIVLDKAGKLKGPILLVLLGVAAIMTLPLVLGNSWVGDAPSGMLKFTRGALLCFVVGVVYSVIAIWVSPSPLAESTPASVSGPASSVPAPAPAPPKESTKIEDKATRSPHDVGRYDLNSITEAIWFGIYVQASATLKDQFRSMDQAALQIYGGAYSINTIDNLPAESYETAWQSTFGKVLMCNPELGISSSMNFVLFQHPYISVSISNNSLSDRKCEIKGYVNRPITTGDIGFVLTGPSGKWPRHAYILDVPITRDAFAVRLFMNGIEMKQLTEGYSPPWKSFAVNDAKDVLRLQIYRKGAAHWVALQELERFLPDKIMLTTDLMYGGPKIVREYKLVSHVPQQTGRGDDASQIFIWAFTWQPIRYAEEHSEFSGN